MPPTNSLGKITPSIFPSVCLNIQTLTKYYYFVPGGGHIILFIYTTSLEPTHMVE